MRPLLRPAPVTCHHRGELPHDYPVVATSEFVVGRRPPRAESHQRGCGVVVYYSVTPRKASTCMLTTIHTTTTFVKVWLMRVVAT
eukprot:7822086-Pyramimonas_sp.AAC.1